jgi:di/tricarboxylate transporter
MNQQLGIVLALLAAAVLMFVINRPRMDAVGLLMLVLLPFTGVLTMAEALAGFSDSNIVLIAALFVIGEGLVRTGVAQRLGDLLTSFAGASETRLVGMLMLVVAGLGSMMSSTAVTAIFIPVALRIASRTGAAPSRLMMPLSAAALISGMLTLVATAPNLVVSAELTRQGHEPFAFFAFTPFGVPILALGIVYMIFARRWLSPKESASDPEPRMATLADWIKKYSLAERERRLRIEPGSPVASKRVDQLDTSGVTLLALERPGRLGREVRALTASTELLANDVIVMDVADPSAPFLGQAGLTPLPLADAGLTDLSQDIGMAEVMVPADSPLVGRTVAACDFRERTALTIVGLQHGAKATPGPVASAKIGVGDTLLVTGAWTDIKRLRPDDSGVVPLRLPAEIASVLPVRGRMWHAVGTLALVVALMISGAVPNVQAALIGCLLMGLFGCITLDSAYRSIGWKSIVLIVGMLPFSLALQRTGGVDLAADALTRVTAGADPRVVLACIFVITAALGLFISNTATAVLMAPVALAVADDLGASPYPFAMTVALAASTAFMTPVSSPVNTLVVTPGRYSFFDFVKVGTPFSIVVMVFCVVFVPIVMPLFTG